MSAVVGKGEDALATAAHHDALAFNRSQQHLPIRQFGFVDDRIVKRLQGPLAKLAAAGVAMVHADLIAIDQRAAQPSRDKNAGNADDGKQDRKAAWTSERVATKSGDRDKQQQRQRIKAAVDVSARAAAGVWRHHGEQIDHPRHRGQRRHDASADDAVESRRPQ